MAKMTIIEQCVDATGIKDKKGEKRQDYLDRLVKAVQDLGDDDWDKLSESAQAWINKAAKAVNADKDIDEPADYKPAADADDDKPRSRRGRDDEGDDEGEGDDDAKGKGKGKAKGGDKDDEDKPRSRRGKEADDDDKGKSRRRGSGDEGDDDKAKGKDKDEDKPRSRRGRDDDAEGDDAKDKDKGKAKDKAEKEKPVKKKSGEGAQASIKRAVIGSPNASTEDIVAKLGKKGIEVTNSAVSTIRSGTLQTLRLVKEIGMPKGDF